MKWRSQIRKEYINAGTNKTKDAKTLNPERYSSQMSVTRKYTGIATSANINFFFLN
jgi:hypothetical protein